MHDIVKNLPSNWMDELERYLLHSSGNAVMVYVCSPCRAEDADALHRNMMAARLYLSLIITHHPGIFPVAPHAFLPLILKDEHPYNRSQALRFCKETLSYCDKLYVCGNRLTEGMKEEILKAGELFKKIIVFDADVCVEVRALLACYAIQTYKVTHDITQPELALSPEELFGGDTA